MPAGWRKQVIDVLGKMENVGMMRLLKKTSFEKVVRECFRVLKPDKYVAILIGDTRRKKLCIPLAFKVMERFLRAGFVLKEDIIKVQHNCKATGFWVKKSKEHNFPLIMHKHLFVFKKA